MYTEDEESRVKAQTEPISQTTSMCCLTRVFWEHWRVTTRYDATEQRNLESLKPQRHLGGLLKSMDDKKYMLRTISTLIQICDNGTSVVYL